MSTAKPSLLTLFYLCEQNEYNKQDLIRFFLSTTVYQFPQIQPIVPHTHQTSQKYLSPKETWYFRAVTIGSHRFVVMAYLLNRGIQ